MKMECKECGSSNFRIKAYRRKTNSYQCADCGTYCSHEKGVILSKKPKSRRAKYDEEADCLMAHSLSGNTLSNARNFSHNSIQGHHHSCSGVERYADKGNMRWAMSTGCLLDPHSPAARYAKGAVFKIPIMSTGMLIGGRMDTLVISDLHLPYQHPDAFEFLFALNEYFKFDLILNVGDIYDHHRGSYHESEPDAMGEEEEYDAAKKYAHELEQIFPQMVITEGNHDQVPKRKLKSAGLPQSVLADYNQMYGTGEGWEWNSEYWFDSAGAFPVVHPMVLGRHGRWDKVIMTVGK